MAIFKGFHKSIEFLYCNLAKCISLQRIDSNYLDGRIYRGCLPEELDRVFEIYTKLTGGAKLSWPKRLLYRYACRKLVTIVIDKQQIVGINLYYFNQRDLLDYTIHEAFIGVLPELQGLGIATSMRLIAKQHFLKDMLKGISTKIYLSNAASIGSAQKIGFNIVERCYEPGGKERLYMICHLE